VGLAENLSTKILSGDWMLWVLLTLNGDAKFLCEKLAVYREGIGVSSKAIWHTDFFYRALFLIKQLSVNKSFTKNLWLLKGVCYFLLVLLSKALKIEFFSILAERIKVCRDIK
jgi:hypothetical protein